MDGFKKTLKLSVPFQTQAHTGAVTGGNISTLWKNSTLTVFSFYNISFIELPPIEEDDKIKEDDEWGMKQVQPVSGEEYK